MLDPIGAAGGCCGEILDDAVAKELVWGKEEVGGEAVAYEAVVLAAVGALDVGVGVPEGDNVVGVGPG